MPDTSSTPDGQADELIRSEEELRVGLVEHEVGRVRARKRVDTERVTETVPRTVEHAEVERVAVGPDDSGEVETLADGSLSIPLLEERLVIEKRLVVRERVIIRKQATVAPQVVEADLRRERIELEVHPPG